MDNSAGIPELDTKGLRNFAFSMAGVIAVLFGLALPWLFSFSWPIWPWVVSAIFLLWGLLAPSTLKLPYKYWMKFGLLLNKITAPIIMGLIFFLVFAPIAIGMRLFKRDTLNRQFDDSAVSYRTVHSPRAKSHMSRPF